MTGAAPTGPRRFPWTAYWIVFALITVFAILPIITTIVAAALTGAYDCNINESVRSVCEIGGTDMGEWLQFGGMSFLYIFLTFPIAIVLFIIWLIVLLVHRARAARPR